MKKLMLIILSILTVSMFSFVVFAGSIDVDLVADDEALVFIGSVDNYTITYEETNYPNTEYSLTITPNEKIKGDVVVGKSMDFEKVRTGKLKLQKNINYLFGYMSNELYVWELASYSDLFDWELDDYTDDSIILKERHNDSIAGSMQEFLNEGVFARGEEERQNNSEQKASTDIGSTNITNNNDIIMYISIILVVLIMLFVSLYVIKHKKRNKQ